MTGGESRRGPQIDIPSMDEIIRQSATSERRSNLRLGLLLVAGGLVTAIGTFALTSGGYFLMPTAAIVVGLGYLFRRPGR